MAKEVAQRALRSRCTDLGKRLIAFHRSYGLKPGGTLGWRKGCYKVLFAEGILASIADISYQRCSGADVHEALRHDLGCPTWELVGRAGALGDRQHAFLRSSS